MFTNVVRPVPEAPSLQQGGWSVRKVSSDMSGGKRTDDHEGELNSLLDLVSPASACKRHCMDRSLSRKEGRFVGTGRMQIRLWVRVALETPLLLGVA